MFLSILIALASPAHAVTVDGGTGWGVGTLTDEPLRAVHTSRVSLGIREGLPRPELQGTYDLFARTSSAAIGLGVRQPIGSRVALAAHGGLLTMFGRDITGYEAGFGVDGTLSVLVIDRTTWGVGLAASVGAGFGFDELPVWTAFTTELRFGR